METEQWFTKDTPPTQPGLYTVALTEFEGSHGVFQATWTGLRWAGMERPWYNQWIDDVVYCWRFQTYPVTELPDIPINTIKPQRYRR